MSSPVDAAASWAQSQLAGAAHLSSKGLRGLIATKSRYASVAEMSDKDFLAGVYQGLCNHFNGGCEIEDMGDETRALLGL
jgi:hypothetical protein